MKVRKAERMKKYEVGYGFIDDGSLVIETSEEYNTLEEATKVFESEKETLNKNSAYKTICLEENIYDNDEIIEVNHLKEYTYEE